MKSNWPKQRRGQRDMSLEVQEWRFEVGRPDAGSRLDAFLVERLRWRSRAGIRQAIETDRVEVLPFKEPQRAPQGRLRPGLRLRRGQEVVVRLPSPQVEEGAQEVPWAANVIFEDDHLLAVDKPASTSVYPSRRHRTGSLIEWVHVRHRERFGAGGFFPTPCHRLDRETTGIVVFAKSREVRAEIGLLLEQAKVRKRYLAIVEGQPDGDCGIVDLALGRSEDSDVEIKVAPRTDGRPACSHWQVLRRFPSMSLMELEPKTGRQHQLRVHMAAIGHPILGDKLYAGGDGVFLRSIGDGLTAEDVAGLGLARQALHAWRLEVRLDSLGRDLRLEAPLPDDMAQMLESESCARQHA